MRDKTERKPIVDPRSSQSFFFIGMFFYKFSQLEFVIRTELSLCLSISEEFFDIVTAPYDFAMLCSVSTEAFCKKNPEKAEQIRKFFKECHSVNEDRKRMAHGLWAQGESSLQARHVSRGTLKPTFFYSDEKDLSKMVEKVHELILKFMELIHGDLFDDPNIELIDLAVEFKESGEKQKASWKAMVRKKTSSE